MSDEPDLMANRYGNVFVMTDARGTSRIMHHKDGTVTGTHYSGEEIRGVWSIENGGLWETFSAPPEAAARGRHGGQRPFAEKKVGDTWEHTLPDGRSFKFALVKGD
jgi:hypothetical protein